MTQRILILPGDGIGPEIVVEAIKVMQVFKDEGIDLDWSIGLIGGVAVDEEGAPYPESTRQAAHNCDAILLGAVGSPKHEGLPRNLRPERGLLDLRKDLDLFANLRPTIVFEELAHASPLKKDSIAGLDLLILRELTGDIYFGQPRGRRRTSDGAEEAFDTMHYSVPEIERIARIGFEAARRRSGRLCSVDKENVLETSRLWREVMIRVGSDYPDVSLSHMYVDNAAMQLLRNPKQFDVLVTGNMFGDILSDESAMLAGSIGLLPSASLNARSKGLYEPIHGSAPDLAGKGLANPLAMILSVGMMFRYTFDRIDLAQRIDSAVRSVLAAGLRSPDIAVSGEKAITTAAMGDAVVSALRS